MSQQTQKLINHQQVELLCVPGHHGIEGNGKADEYGVISRQNYGAQ